MLVAVEPDARVALARRQTGGRDDGKGTSTYVYDTATEHRGLVTSLGVGAASAPSTFTATYNGDGSLASQAYPSGLVSTTRYNNNAEPTSLAYVKSGTPWLTFSQANSIYGQIRLDATVPATKTLGYDPSGRLTSVVDAVSYGGPRICTTRTYTYDLDSNRTALTSYPDAGGQPDTGNCSTSTTPAVYSHTYDQADRITDTGYAYDRFGRSTSIPAADAGGAAQTVGFNTNDLVASQTAGSTTRTYTLDPAGRLRNWTDASTTSTNHYPTATGDSPTWIGATGSTWTRNITGIDGTHAALQTDTGVVTLQLSNLHGDIVATTDDTTSATSITTYAESNEFGIPYSLTTAYPRYGWLGAEQRSHDTLGGLTLMGIRLYNSYTGRFLQTDPILNGNSNPYDYAAQNPYNAFDLDGRMGCGTTGGPYAIWPKNCGKTKTSIGSVLVKYAAKTYRVTVKVTSNGYVKKCAIYGTFTLVGSVATGGALAPSGVLAASACAAAVVDKRFG